MSSTTRNETAQAAEAKQMEQLLRTKLENMDWTLEGDEQYAHLIMTCFSQEEGATEAGMRAYLHDLMNRDEDDPELVELVHWLFHDARNEAQRALPSGRVFIVQPSAQYDFGRLMRFLDGKDPDDTSSEPMAESCTGDAGMEAEEGF